MNLTTLDLDVVWTSHWDVKDSDVYGGADVEVGRRYAGVGHRRYVVVASILLVWNVSCEHASREDGCDHDNVDVRDYV